MNKISQIAIDGLISALAEKASQEDLTTAISNLANVVNDKASPDDLSALEAAIQAQLNAKATPADIATAITNLLAGAPGALDTLNELAAALDNDANFSTTITNSLATKAPLDSPAFTGTPSGITKAHVGLGSVDNTADTAKPVSTAQQTALNLKANLASPTFTGTVSGITKAMVGLNLVDNTSDLTKPISTAQQTALDLKAPLSEPIFSGTVRSRHIDGMVGDNSTYGDLYLNFFSQNANSANNVKIGYPGFNVWHQGNDSALRPATITTGPGSDWNTLITAGHQPFLYIGNTANGPGDPNYYFVQVYTYAGTEITQVAYPYAMVGGGAGRPSILTRTKYASAWGAWRRFIANEDKPVFAAVNTAEGPAANSNIIFTSTSINQGSCYNVGNGRFTAPVAGLYKFETALFVRTNGVATQYGYIQFFINGSNSGPTWHGEFQSTQSYYTLNASNILNLAQGDYVNVFLGTGASGSNMYGGVYNSFTGHLL